MLRGNESGRNLISCTKHIDENCDMLCDFCGLGFPLSDYLRQKSVEAVASDYSVVRIAGNMPDDTVLETTGIAKNDATLLAQKYLGDVVESDILCAYDISMLSKAKEYQPGDYSQVVKVNISNLDLDIKGSVGLLHIIDDENYEIVPLSMLSANEIEFKATRFSKYILIYVDTYEVAFSGDGDFKVYDATGIEITENMTITEGTDFSFVIIPNDGYGILDVKLEGSSSDSTADNYLELTGGISGKTCKINKVSENLEISITTALAPNITVQPVDTKVTSGVAVSYSVTAENATTFTWQYRENVDDYWKDVTSSIGINTINNGTSTLDIKNVNYLISGYEFRCLIGNDSFAGDERIKSNTVSLIIAQDEIAAGEAPIILEQPQNQKVQVENSAAFEITALGSNLTFTWQYRESEDDYWKTMVDTIGSSSLEEIDDTTMKSTLTTVATTYLMSGYEFRCLIGNDYYNNDHEIKSNVVSLSVAQGVVVTGEAPVIVVQPENQKVEPNNPAVFEITAMGENVTFVWQYRESGDDYWKKVDDTIGSILYTPIDPLTTKAILETVVATYDMSGYEFRCLVGNEFYQSNDAVKSDVASLIVAQGIISGDIIYEQPIIELSASSGDSPSEITLTWTVDPEIRYELYFINDSGNLELIPDNTTSPYVHRELEPNTTYEYVIYGYKDSIPGYRAEGSAIGYTAYDDIYDIITKDTVKPVITNDSVSPSTGVIGQKSEIVITFDAIDLNYDYEKGSLLTAKDIEFIIDGTVITGVSGELTKVEITSGERFTLKATNIIGSGDLVIRVPAGVIIDLATNPNDAYEINTNLEVSESRISTEAPELVPDVHSIKVTNKQTSLNEIETIIYEYRISGDTEFIKFIETTDETIEITGLYSDTDYEVRTTVIDIVNNRETSESAFTTTKKIGESAIEITYAPEKWVNTEVIATIKWNDTTYKHEYSTNNIDWVTATDAETDVTFTENGILYARYFDGRGYSDTVEHKIENIDKIKPTIGDISVPEGKANTKVISVTGIEDKGGSGIYGYYVGTSANLTNAIWKELDGNSFTYEVLENDTYYVFVIDNAGNISAEEDSTKITIDEIVDKVNILDYDKEITVKVFEEVTPKITYSGEAESITYEIVNTTIATVEDGVVTGETIGITTLKVTFTDYDGTETPIEITVNVIGATPEFELSSDTIEVIYGDKDEYITYTHSDDNVVIATESSNSNIATAIVDNANNKITIVPENVGETTITIKAEATSQYAEATKELKVKVIPKIIEVEWNYNNPFTYDGTEKVVTARITNLENGDNVGITYKDNKKTDAGNYTATIIGLDNSNYTIDGASNLSKDWLINKADRTLVINPITQQLMYAFDGTITFTYDGEDTTASVESNNTDIIDVKNYTDTDKGGTIVISTVAGGTATITVYVPATTNYNEVSGEATIEVTKNTFADIEIEDAPTQITYGDDPVDFGYSYSGDGEISVETGDSNIISAIVSGDRIVITPEGAGETTVTIKAEETPQFVAEEKTITIVVNPRIVELVWSEKTFTYDGNEHTVTATVENKVGNDVVEISEYTNNTKVDPGKYIAEATELNNPNYTLEGCKTASHEWEILKATIMPTITMDSYIYGGIKATPTISGNTGSGAVTYFVYSGNDQAKAINWDTVTSSISLAPGTYSMYAEVAETDYYDSAKSNTVTFEIKILDLVVTLEENNEAYDGEWTNNDVVATIEVPAEVTEAVDIYYRIKNETTLIVGAYINGNTATITFDNDFNNEIYFVAVDTQGNLLTNENGAHTIKVDKSKPVIGKIEIDPELAEKANSKYVKVSDVVDYGGSGIAEYGVSETQNSNDAIWTPNTEANFSYEVFENKTYYVFVKDVAGNISDVTANTQITVENIVPKVGDVTIEDNLVVKVDETIPPPTISYSGEAKQIIYGIEDENIATINPTTGTITGVASGDTKVTVKLVNYDGSVKDISTSLKVIPKDATITVNEPTEFIFTYGGSSATTTFEYDGNATADDIIIKSNDESIAKIEIIDGNRIIATPGNAGTTTITISAPATPQFNAVSAEIKVTVNPRPISLTWTSGDFTYDGTEKTVTATITNLVTGDKEPTLTYSENVKINAGKYTARVESVSDPNYTTNGANVNYNWEIKKEKRKIEMTESLTLEYGQTGEIVFTYDGEDATAIVSSNVTSVATGTLIDTVNGGTVTVDAHSGGECEIKVTIPATQNYDTVEGICKVTIIATEPELTIDKTELEFIYGDALESIPYRYNGNGRVTVSVSDPTVVDADIVEDKIVVTPLGATLNEAATVTLTTSATPEYKQASVTISVVIKPRPINVEWNANEFEYDGKEKEVIVSNIVNLVEGDKIDFTYSENIKTLVGNYTAKIVDIIGNEAHNYTLEGGTNITHDWVINKAEREISVQKEISLKYGEEGKVEFRYNGEDVEAGVTNTNDNVATITYEDGNNKGTVTITPNATGTSTVTITIPESPNYKAGTASFVINVLRATPEISLSATGFEFIYGDNSKEISYNYNGNGEVKVNSSDTNVVTGIATQNTILIDPGYVGTATLTVISDATPQFESVSATIEITVLPRPIDVRWGTTTFIYDGTEKTITATVRNIVPGDTVTITEYEGNKQTEIGNYEAKVVAISNNNYTLNNGTNLETTWEIKELLPPDIIVKQGEVIVESGTWASGEVMVTIEGVETNGEAITYEYSYNGEDWIHYSGPFVISRNVIEEIIYARAYNSVNGVAMSLIGEYKLKLDSTDPTIRVSSINITDGADKVINKDSTVTIEITLEDLISGINNNEFTAEDIEVIQTYKGMSTKLTNITKVFVADPANNGIERGNYKYTLTLSGIEGNGRIDLRIPEKSIYDRALRYNKLVTINLSITSDNEGPEVGIIETSADSYGNVFGDEVELKVTASDESGIESYEWQYSKDGITWQTFEVDSTFAEISEVIYKVIDEGGHYFRVIVADKVGNESISQTATVNVNMTMNRKPTIRFETEQLSTTQVKITAIIKSTRTIESIKVNTSSFEKSEWEDKVVKINNELTITMDYIVMANGLYTWTVVDDIGNIVTEKVNITTIDPLELVIAYETFDATEYSLAKIVFKSANNGNDETQDMRIIRVEKPNGDKINIEKGNECIGMLFNTTNFTKEVTVKLNSFEAGTTFVFENKSSNEKSVTVMENIDTNVMYVRIAEGINLFDTMFGNTFSIINAETLVKQMLSKTIGISGSIENYYGISNTSMALKVSDQDELMAAEYLSEATNMGETLRMNQYGDPEKLKATVEQNSGVIDDATYISGNTTGIKDFGEIINWGANAIKKSFRITMRAR